MVISRRRILFHDKGPGFASKSLFVLTLLLGEPHYLCMDLDKILHFVPSHIEQIIAVLGALFLVTTILLLIRSLKEKPDNSNAGLDVRSIEGALKRVLDQNPITVVEKAGGESTTVTADLAPLKNALAEKEKQLSQLNAELTEAKAAAAAAAAAAGAISVASSEAVGSAAAVAGLEIEISDLKARLAEYEIIEDDIADLALYKEENARLKREIEEARVTGAPQDEVASPVIEANPAAEPELDPLAELLAGAPEVSIGEEEPDGLLGLLDTDKMLAEAEGFADSPANDATNDATNDVEINALSDLLDTDKLLEEVNSLDAQDVMSEFKDKSKLG